MVRIVSFHAVHSVSTKHVIHLTEPVCPDANLTPMVIHALQVLLTHLTRITNAK